MKLLITLALLLPFSNSFSQWTRVQQLPPSNIFTLYHKDSVLYAGGTNIIYVSKNRGQSWTSTSPISQTASVNPIIDNIIVFKNELYAASRSKAVFKSLDDGTTWQVINAGIPPLVTVTDFCEYEGDLYAATEGSLGNPIYKLDSFSGNHWLGVSNGLSNLSTNVNSIIGNSHALIAGTNNNGIYDYLPANTTTWEERFLTNPVSVNEGAFDIITAHDTLFWPGKTGRFYMSTDNGLNWNLFGARLVTGATSLVNAKQALLSSRYIFDGVNNITLFYYLKKDSLQSPFVNFSVLNLFTYKMDILGDKLWDASDKGLFFMSLPDLPGITAAEDSVAAGPLPIRFISFTANCQTDKLVLTWKTAQEQNSSHFDIEKSIDGIHWTVIGNQPAAGNSGNERTYSFTNSSSFQNNFYCISEYDLDGKVQYSNILRSSCSATDLLSFWPNPVYNRMFISIVAGKASQAKIKIFDSKGALIKTQRANLLKGSNQLGADMTLLPNGPYHLSVEWSNGQVKKTAQVLKQ